MDSFFDFDASILVEDGGLEGGMGAGGGLSEEDEDYDALNEETFGASATAGDWEESHEHLVTLTEADRRRAQAALDAGTQDNSDGLVEDLVALGLGHYEGRGPRAGGGSAPINIGGYPGVASRGVSSLIGGTGDLPGSPSAPTIWTPSPGLDKLRPMMRGSPPDSVGVGGPPPPMLPGIAPAGLGAVKTVAELEQEMRLQQNRVVQQPGLGLHLNALRAEDLERELARQSVGGGKQTGPGLGSHNTGAPHHHYPQHQGSRLQGPQPPNHASHPFMNRQFQRPPSSQGPYPTLPQQQYPPGRPPLTHQGQQQRLPSSFPSAASNSHKTNLFSQQPPPPHQQPPPPHHQHPHHHHDGPNYPHHNHHHHPHHHHNSYNSVNNHNSHYQLQQPGNFYHNNRSGGGPEGGERGHYFNHNGYDGGNGRPGSYERRGGYDRRYYDQGRPGYDQNKSQYGSGSREEYQSNSQQGGGGRVRRDSEAEWEEWQRLRERDQYCGLMTPREKSWLKHIQAMQLHSDSPYEDDYYYVMYRVRKQGKREEEVVALAKGMQYILGNKDKEGGREYEPPRLENSLGKLQVVSVNAPRKIIDLEVVHLDPSHPTTPIQREMRRHRHLLLYMEKLFNIMMELDDLGRKIRHLPDCPTRDHFRVRSRHLATRLWHKVTESPEMLPQVLCIRKGKSLMGHLVPWLGEQEQEQLMLTLVRNLSQVAKRDTHDQYLTGFWPLTDRLVASASMPRLLELAQALTVSPGPSNRTSNTVAALYCKYGVSLVLGLMVRGEQLHSSMESCKAWQELLHGVVGALVSSPAPSDTTSQKGSGESKSGDMPQALPSVAVAAAAFPPAQHLSRCLGVEPALLTAAQDKLGALAAGSGSSTNTTKPRSQSPMPVRP